MNCNIVKTAKFMFRYFLLLSILFKKYTILRQKNSSLYSFIKQKNKGYSFLGISYKLKKITHLPFIINSYLYLLNLLIALITLSINHSLSTLSLSLIPSYLNIKKPVFRQ